MRPCQRLFVAALMLGAALPATAQDPVRIPGVTVRAAPPLPGPKIFAGIVRDTEATPLAGVEVIIPELQRRVFSGVDGSFRFTEMPKGNFMMRARKIGYAPQIRTFKMEGEGGAGTFELVPWPFRMPPVVTSAVLGGISGRVADTSYAAVEGAVVTVPTKGLITTTDSSGSFYLPAPGGSWMVFIRKPGYADRIASVTVPRDSGRHVAVMLLPEQKLPAREAHNIDNLETRLNWRDKLKQPFYTHEDMEKLGYTWLYDLVRKAGLDQYSLSCAVVINGGPATRTLGSLTIDEVESVEIYGAEIFKVNPAAEIMEQRLRAAALGRPSGGNGQRAGRLPSPPKPTGASAAAFARIPVTNAAEAAWENQGVASKCPSEAIYVWLR